MLLGDGAAGFTVAAPIPVGQAPTSLAVANFDGDEHLDVAIVNGSSRDISILLGNGRGGFSSTQTLRAGSGPFALAVADFNRDKQPDLAVVNDGEGKVVIMTNRSR